MFVVVFTYKTKFPTWMANISAMATKDFCPPLSWFISRISLFLPVKLTAQDTPVAFSSLCA